MGPSGHQLEPHHADPGRFLQIRERLTLLSQKGERRVGLPPAVSVTIALGKEWVWG